MPLWARYLTFALIACCLLAGLFFFVMGWVIYWLNRAM